MTVAIDDKKLRALELAAEIEVAKGDFNEFLQYVYILEPAKPHLGIAGGPVEFQRWPHLMELNDALVNPEHLQIVVGKARQLGFSWDISAYVAWQIWRDTNYLALLLSRGQTESQELISKVKFIYRHLPQHWQLPIVKDSGSEFAFEGSDSKVVALPSTEDAGTSFTASLVVQDEAEKHEYIDQSYSAIEPTINAGGQLVMGSSRKKLRGANLFIDTYRGAPHNGWHKIFWGCFERDERDHKWYERTRTRARGLQEAQLMGVELFMEQEYPRNEGEFLKASSVLSAFDQEALEGMRVDVKQPVQKIGPISIYQKWRLGRKYMAGTDTSHGVGKDYSVTVIMDAQTGYIVADVMSSVMSVEDLAYQSLKMLEMYRNPIWGIEDNEWGVTVIQAAQRVRYPRIFHRETTRGSRKIGWHTDNASVWVMWGELIEAVSSRLISVPNGEGLDQFGSVIRNPEKNGKIEALKGAHDDYPVAAAIAWQMRKWAHSTGQGGTSFRLW